MLDFENGAIGVLESSVVATGRKNYLGWEINGSHGSLRWDLEHPNSLFACIDRGEPDDSLLGFTEISVTEGCHPYVGRVVAAGSQHRLGTRADHREVPLPRRRGQPEAAESLQRHI